MPVDFLPAYALAFAADAAEAAIRQRHGVYVAAALVGLVVSGLIHAVKEVRRDRRSRRP